MSAVSLRGLRKYFSADGRVTTAPRRGAIDGLDLEVRNGEFFVLLGPSGCGKTTTLRCVAGLEEPSAGRILIGGETVADAEGARFVPPNRRNVGMVFQSYALWPHMTVFDNVAYPLRRARQKRKPRELAAEVEQALALVGLGAQAFAHPAELSGGQQQRVALARALVARPRLLLFDEPLSNLDAQLRVRLRYDLRRIHEETGHTSIYVTHDQSEALALADRVAVMKLGRIEQLGTPEDIFRAPATRFVAEFVGFDNLLAGTVTGHDAAGTRVRPDGWRAPIVGRASAPFAVGAPVWVAVRSTHLQLALEAADTPADTAGANRWTGRLEGATYAGDRYQAEAELDGASLLGTLALRSGVRDATHARGLPVQVHAAPEDVVILPRDESADDAAHDPAPDAARTAAAA